MICWTRVCSPVLLHVRLHEKRHMLLRTASTHIAIESGEDLTAKPGCLCWCRCCRMRLQRLNAGHKQTLPQGQPWYADQSAAVAPGPQPWPPAAAAVEVAHDAVAEVAQPAQLIARLTTLLAPPRALQDLLTSTAAEAAIAAAAANANWGADQAMSPAAVPATQLHGAPPAAAAATSAQTTAGTSAEQATHGAPRHGMGTLPAAAAGTASGAARRGDANQALPPTWQPAEAFRHGPPAVMRVAVSAAPAANSSAGSQAAAQMTGRRSSLADAVLADLRQRAAGAQLSMPQSSMRDVIGSAQRQCTAERRLEDSGSPGLDCSQGPGSAATQPAEQRSGICAAVSPAQPQHSAAALHCGMDQHDAGCDSEVVLQHSRCQVRLSCARTLRMLRLS